MIARNEIPLGQESQFVALITAQQKDEISGKMYAPDSYFNPVEDGNDPSNWVISVEEVDQTVNEDFLWVKDLPMIPWVPPVSPIDENNP